MRRFSLHSKKVPEQLACALLQHPYFLIYMQLPWALTSLRKPCHRTVIRWSRQCKEGRLFCSPLTIKPAAHEASFCWTTHGAKLCLALLSCKCVPITEVIGSNQFLLFSRWCSWGCNREKSFWLHFLWAEVEGPLLDCICLCFIVIP